MTRRRTSGQEETLAGVPGVVIVGGSLAGLQTAEALRGEGWTRPITVVDSRDVPFHDRPPMSKDYLAGTVDSERLLLRDTERLDGLDVTWELGRTAVKVDVHRHAVTLDDGRDLAYGDLVVATGVSPIVPPSMDVPAAHSLRRIEDADRLRGHLHPGAALIVIGAGFIGLEVAATFRKAGARVDVVETSPTPLYRQAGPRVGDAVRRLHEEQGVAFHLGRKAVSVAQTDERVSVTLDDGTVLTGDALLVAVGSVPGTGWLDGSGLNTEDGLLTDERLRAGPAIHAVGDVARWPHPLARRTVRTEHWTNAIEQAKYVAKQIAGTSDGAPFAGLPYFWSDQFDRRIQAHGFIDAEAELEVIDGDLDSRSFAAVYVADGRATAVIGMNKPRQVLAGRRRVVADLAKQEVSS